MIVDDPEEFWIFIVPSEKRRRVPMTYDEQQKIDEEYLEHWGKWLIFAKKEYLEDLAKKLDKYVEEGRVPSAKYGRSPQLGNKVPVMCVYCDDGEKERVWGILSSMSVTRRIWKYDRQTLKDWEPEGRLYKKWIQTSGIEKP